MNYYAVDLTGMLDMRSVYGPFTDVEKARGASEIMNKAGCKVRVIPVETVFISINQGYVNGPFRARENLESDMKEAQEDSTIGNGSPSLACRLVEMLIGLHQSFGELDTVTAVVEEIREGAA